MLELGSMVQYRRLQSLYLNQLSLHLPEEAGPGEVDGPGINNDIGGDVNGGTFTF